MMDDREVFYDAWWDHTQNWGLAKKINCSYYRIPLSLARTNTVFQRNEPLSDSEQLWHQPQLPLRTACTNSWLWNERDYETLAVFREALTTANGSLPEGFEEPTVLVEKLSLIPSGPAAGAKPSTVVVPVNGVAFTQLELLWQAHQLQKKYRTPHDNGVGLYRDGIDRKVPSYLLAGPISPAEEYVRKFYEESKK